MRILLALVLTLTTHVLFAQVDSAKIKQLKINQAKMKDTLITAIQTGVGISHAMADSTWSLINGYTLKIRAVVRSRIPKDQKDQQTKSLAAERDDKIRHLLTDDQIIRLKAVYSRSKQAAPAH